MRVKSYATGEQLLFIAARRLPVSIQRFFKHNMASGDVFLEAVKKMERRASVVISIKSVSTYGSHLQGAVSADLISMARFLTTNTMLH